MVYCATTHLDGHKQKKINKYCVLQCPNAIQNGGLKCVWDLNAENGKKKVLFFKLLSDSNVHFV